MSYTRDSSKDLVWDENSNSYVSESAEPTTIAEAIAAAQQRVAAVYTAISNKGVTLPQTQNLSNMPTAIDSIAIGWTPKKIKNGKVTVSDNKLPDLTGVTEIDNYVYPYAYFNSWNMTMGVDFRNITKIGTRGCYDMFNGSKVTSANLDSLSTIGESGCQAMFAYTRVTAASLPSLVTVNEYNACDSMFRGISYLTSVSLPALTTISGPYGLQSIFNSDYNLTSANISIPNLETISGSYGFAYAFQDCTGLTTFTFPKLSTIGQYALAYCFKGCTSLTNIYFSSLTSSSFGATYKNQFYNMLQGVTGCTLHFPSSVSSNVQSLTGYPNFGGTNTVLLFDLPATS